MSNQSIAATQEILLKAIEALKLLDENPGELLGSRTTESSESTEESETTEATETTEHSENKEGKEGTEDTEGSEDSESSETTENSEDTENSEASESSEDTENQEGLIQDIYAPLVQTDRDALVSQPNFSEYKDRLKGLANVLESRLRNT